MSILETFEETPSANEMLKAFDNGTIKKLNKPKSAIIDPYGTQGVMGVRPKPTAVPYATLRMMAQVPAVSAIINTRLNQVARFARRPRFEGDMGFKIVLKDKDAKMDENEKKQAFEIEEFFMKTGAVPNAQRKDNFDKFLRKIVRDSLTVDAVTWEHVSNRKNGLAEIWAVDPTTIELVATNPVGDGNSLPVYSPVTKRGQMDKGDIAYVQKVDGQTIAEYTEDEMCYAIRNPRTDIYTVDFGLSELETLIEVITGIMNGVRYNTSYFSESHLPQGVLEIVGKYEDKHLEAFKRHWKTMTNGAGGKWAVPVMALTEGQGFKFTPFKQSNRDMEFNEFLEFLFNVACAVYQIDPNEVGFKSWTSGSSSMGQSDNTAVKINESKDKGLIPLMQFLANTFNSEIVDRIDDKFALMWIGVDDEDEEAKQARDKMNVDMGKVTIAELRKRDDMEEILGDDGKPAPWTLAPANATLIQVYMAEVNAKMQAQQAEQAGQDTANANTNAQMTSDDAHKKAMELSDKTHQQTLAGKAQDQTNAMASKAQDQANSVTNSMSNQNNSMSNQNNSMKNTEQAQKNGLVNKASDQKHAQNMEAMKQRAGASNKSKSLKKSLDATDDEELEITIDWTDY